ncbi:MAG TPA: thiamine phosphate synthase [Aliiroseovarius sp.]|nr:thiamine phosphate synthase [Aliiroseovarius sp.]
MSEPQTPQLYLICPAEIDLTHFPAELARVLDSAPIACIRLALATQDEDALIRAADALREVAHARDIPLVIDDHFMLAARLGLDGVHLTDGARRVRKARAELGADAIVGAFCGASRHEGLNAGEAGADYISFGPVGTDALGDGSQADPDLFLWWSEMIEIPVVAEGALDVDTVRQLAPRTDFFAIGEEIWRADDAVQALAALSAPLAG